MIMMTFELKSRMLMVANLFLDKGYVLDNDYTTIGQLPLTLCYNFDTELRTIGSDDSRSTMI